jgi:hypothetical protein
MPVPLSAPTHHLSPRAIILARITAAAPPQSDAFQDKTLSVPCPPSTALYHFRPSSSYSYHPRPGGKDEFSSRGVGPTTGRPPPAAATRSRNLHLSSPLPAVRKVTQAPTPGLSAITILPTIHHLEGDPSTESSPGSQTSLAAGPALHASYSAAERAASARDLSVSLARAYLLPAKPHPASTFELCLPHWPVRPWRLCLRAAKKHLERALRADGTSRAPMRPANVAATAAGHGTMCYWTWMTRAIRVVL